MPRTTDLDTLAQALLDVQRPVVITGAGLGVASGIPTYRDGPDALWAQQSTSWATAERFDDDPAMWWHAFGFAQREVFRDRVPNAGHHALVALLDRLPPLRVISQNVDGLERATGASTDRLVELHGTIDKLCCVDVDCAGWRGFGEGDAPVRVGTPRCPVCFAIARPLVMFFGEDYGAHPALRSFVAKTWLAEADFLLLIGTSDSLSFTANAIASADGRRVPIFAVNPIAHDDAWTVVERAEVALPLLVDALGFLEPR